MIQPINQSRWTDSGIAFYLLESQAEYAPMKTLYLSLVLFSLSLGGVAVAHTLQMLDNATAVMAQP